MNRNMTGGVIAALSQPSLKVCHLLDLDLSEPAYLTDAPSGFTWAGKAYAPSHLLRFGEITESLDLALHRTSVTISGVDQSGIAYLLLYEYLNRSARIYKALMTDALEIIADPVLLVSGRLDGPVVATDPEQGLCEISMDIVSRETPLGRSRARYTNPASQALLFPDDQGFEHVSEVEQTLVWGGKGHFTGTSIPRGAGPRNTDGSAPFSLRRNNTYFGGGG
jgi:hypothetical protein